MVSRYIKRVREQQREYYDENKDKIMLKKKERLQNDNEFRMSNKEYYKERYQREKHLYQKYYQTHKEEIIKKRAEYYHKNKERISERRKELYR